MQAVLVLVAQVALVVVPADDSHQVSREQQRLVREIQVGARLLISDTAVAVAVPVAPVVLQV